jgi:hypothetical protein
MKAAANVLGSESLTKRHFRMRWILMDFEPVSIEPGLLFQPGRSPPLRRIADPVASVRLTALWFAAEAFVAGHAAVQVRR